MLNRHLITGKIFAMTERNAVRAIILTPDERVLMLRIRLPGVSPFWIAPGGGIEPGETAHYALLRTPNVGSSGKCSARRVSLVEGYGSRPCYGAPDTVIAGGYCEQLPPFRTACRTSFRRNPRGLRLNSVETSTS